MEPFGDDWWQTGVIASAAVNPHVKRSLKAEDFMPIAPSIGETDQNAIERMLASMAGVAI